MPVDFDVPRAIPLNHGGDGARHHHTSRVIQKPLTRLCIKSVPLVFECHLVHSLPIPQTRPGLGIPLRVRPGWTEEQGPLTILPIHRINRAPAVVLPSCLFKGRLIGCPRKNTDLSAATAATAGTAWTRRSGTRPGRAASLELWERAGSGHFRRAFPKIRLTRR